jgi:hypothetical protein
MSDRAEWTNESYHKSVNRKTASALTLAAAFLLRICSQINNSAQISTNHAIRPVLEEAYIKLLTARWTELLNFSVFVFHTGALLGNGWARFAPAPPSLRLSPMLA